MKIWGAPFVLVALVLITYQPSFRMGLYLDDYYNIERAGRIEESDALRQIFDPRAQTLWYRPLQGLQFFIAVRLFGANANAYHLLNITYHAINVLLVYALAWRMSQKWLLGLASAFFYATFTVYISGVNWAAIVEPLLSVPYLLSIWFWWSYLAKAKRRDYTLALVTLILALMAKQTAVTIPIVFFLLDRFIVRQPLGVVALVRRYALLVFVTLFFVFLQYSAQSTYTFAGTFGWKPTPEMARIFWEYLVLLFVPWGAFPSIDLNPPHVGDAWSYAWVVMVLSLLIVFGVLKRSRALFVLAMFTSLTLLPVLPFPFLEHRYVYLPIISVAVILGWLWQRTHATWSQYRRAIVAASFALALIAFGNGLALNDSVATAAEWARQLRVPYRDIERQNPAFPPDTLLYFIDPITPTEGGLSGMFFLRYGKGVTVRNWTQYAGLREHNAAWVYYFDEQRRPQKINVEKNATTIVAPALPIDFQIPLRLEGYEVSHITLKRGMPLALIFYWRALDDIPQDYSVFVHLVDRNGTLVKQSDGQPRKGRAPMTTWTPRRSFTDVVLIPIDADVSVGENYQLVIGIYAVRTGMRVLLQDAPGQPPGDSITISSFRVVE
ncbi:MAG: hypothetical protein FJ009_11905 [Chloroflexi bacterium]|nr:hypothetical protein [Chloroflexota bacterium]